MRVCLISYYHLDVTVSDFKYLQDYCNVDLYFVYNDGQKSADAVDMTGYETKNGLVPKEVVRDVIENQLKGYISSDKDNVFFYEVSGKGYSYVNNYFLFYKLAMIIKGKHYDVVHIIGQSPLLAILHMFLRGVRKVHTLHETTAHWGNTRSDMLWFLTFLSKQNLQLIFNSKRTLERFRSHTNTHRNNCHVIYFGYFEHYRSHPIEVKMSKNTILFFGNIREHKGLAYLIEAMKIVKMKIPDVNLIIAGRWNDKALKSSIANDPNMTIIDKFLDSFEVVQLMAQSLFVVCPYISASQSGVVNTAFTFFKPVVASEIDGLMEVVEDGKSGILVPPTDISKLADAIITLLMEDDRLESMVEYIKNNEKSEKFSWPSIAKKYYELYQSITLN